MYVYIPACAYASPLPFDIYGFAYALFGVSELAMVCVCKQLLQVTAMCYRSDASWASTGVRFEV